MTAQKSLLRDFNRLPLFLLVFGFASAAMFVPAVYGGVTRELYAARTFLYGGILGLVVFGLVAIAHAGRPARFGTLGPLLSLLACFLVLPVGLAIPLTEAAPNLRFADAYLDMVGAITTTGISVFDEPGQLSRTQHLWRAQVGWMGGLIMWVAASAVLAPLNLGGFEVTAQNEPGQRSIAISGQAAMLDPRARLIRIIRALVPIYAGLTLLLWMLLLLSGDEGLTALSHAMAIMATSGISVVDGVEHARSGLTGEAVMALFMLFALSRLTFSKDTITATQGGLLTDPEFRIGVGLTICVPVLLFAHHWFEITAASQAFSLTDVGLALWGSVFTVLSFLSTTGFVSAEWGTAQVWSGLTTPGLVLMGLALIGGGVATTAGGVKLLRVFALYRNGLREMQRLVHPSSVSGAGTAGRRLQRNGAYIAWIFFMLFALSLAVTTMVLAATGLTFEQSIITAIATLSTTGPLMEVGGVEPIRVAEMTDAAKAVMCAAMVIGRLETLAIIALLTPDLWRD